MKSENTSWLPLLIVAVLILFASKGGDSPSPRPSHDVLAAQAGREYLRGLADLFESIELPEEEADFGEPFNKAVMEVYAESFQVIDDTLAEQNYPEGTKQAMEEMAQGFREVAE